MSPWVIRPATRDDVLAIVALLADDPLGAAREDLTDEEPYLAAYDRIRGDAAQRLVVAEQDGRVVGTLQLSIVPGLSRRGATRSIIEGRAGGPGRAQQRARHRAGDVGASRSRAGPAAPSCS